MEKIEVEILGLSLIPATGAFAIILKESNGTRHLPMMIGGIEANSIAFQLNGIKTPRPMTHDLITNIIMDLNLTLTDVTITELKDGVFYSKLNMESISKKFAVDARPSDAIAVAVRLGVPIYIMNEVLQSSGFMNNGSMDSASLEAVKILMGITDVKSNPILDENANIHKISEEFKKSQLNKKTSKKGKATSKQRNPFIIEKLEMELENLVKDENYEGAAKVRDEILKINKSKK